MRLIQLAGLAAFLTLPAWAQTAQPARGPASVQSPAKTPAGGDLEFKEDLRQMRALLNQMRTNLAFVGSTTTPLAHQFQLEIDMWQALLDRMERREQEESGGKQSPQ